MKNVNSLTRHSLAACALLVLATIARAVNPPPDGGYPGGNTAEGENALFSLTTGQFDTAVGTNALYGDTSGSANTATGYQTLRSNMSGGGNTATGYQSLYSNTTGGANTAIGSFALFENITGGENTAVGADTLDSNKFGSNNTAIGFGAMLRSRNGNSNTATGHFALFRNINGSSNTANGDDALTRNTTGSNNIAVGASSGFRLTIGDNNIDIGNKGVADESNTIRIGAKGTQQATFVAGVRGTTTRGMDAVPVVIDSDGQLGTVSSSARFKSEIKPMDKSSEAILALKPVTFQYKTDSVGTAQFGLIAEEVAKVDPDLVVREEDGKVSTVRYEAVNAMLLNEFLKEHGKVETLQGMVARQQKQIEALTTGLQKVSDQVQLTKPTPRIVATEE